MPNFTDLTGLAGVAGALAACLLWVPWVKRLANNQRAWLTGAVFVMVLIPFNGFPLAAYVRGATGDLSITTVVLLWCALLRPWLGTASNDSRHRVALLVLVSLAAIVLYPMALGLGALDPYRLGYGSGPFVAALLLVVLAAWFRKSYLIVFTISFAAFAWSVGWYESANLWDYLLDPFVSIYALAAIMKQAAKALCFKTGEPTNRQARDLP